MQAAALPPGPRAPRAVQVAAWVTRPLSFATRCQQRFGDTFTAYIEPRPWVLLADPEHIRTVFTGRPDRYHAGAANAVLRPTLGPRSVLLLDEDEHLRHRRMLLPAFHGEALERHRALMSEVAARLVEGLPREGAVALRPYTQAVTLEVILRVVFGAEGGQLERLRALLTRLLKGFGSQGRLGIIAALGPDHPVVRRLTERDLRDVDAELYRLIAQRRAAGDGDGRDDILSLLLRAGGLDDCELRDELMTLLLAGHETTATALAWAFERLAHHPGMIERIAAEADAGETAYTDAVAKEALRLRPVVGVVIRRLTHDTEIGDHVLPAGASVVPCIALVHRRGDLYPDPHAFRPERHLNGGPGTYAWIPFGGGVRRCLGAAFAQLEMQVVLQALATRRRLAPASRAEPMRRRAVTFAPARGGVVRMAGAR